MTPFQQSRIWWREATNNQRFGSALAIAVVATLIGWLIAPVHHGTSAVASAGLSTGATSPGQGPSQSGSPTAAGAGQQTGSGGPGASTRLAGGVSTGAAAGTGSGGGSSGGNAPSGPSTGGSTGTGTATGPQAGGTSPSGRTSGSATTCLPTVAGQGVTNSQVNVAVTIIDIAGSVGDGAFGVPDPTQQQADWQYVADAINAKGGAGCRKLALSYYNVNPADPNNAQQECLAIAGAHPFMALDTGSLTDTGASDCIPEQRVPLVSAYLTEAQIRKYAPYYIAPGSVTSGVIHNGILALNQEGYFTAAKGFAKLGIVYTDCNPNYYQAMRQALSQAGVPNSKIVTYNYGCPTGGENNPADVEQAVLTFKSAGVTDVTEVVDTLADFSKDAAQQNYKPKYILADTAATASSMSGANAPDAANFDGAIDMTGGRYGEEHTPGYQPAPGTAACNAIFAAHNMPPVYQQPDGYGGVTCEYLFFVAELIDHAPSLQRNELVAGMNGIGTYDPSYPAGPVNFAAAPAGSGYGIGYWRTDEFFGSCSCWKVVDPVFHPSF